MKIHHLLVAASLAALLASCARQEDASPADATADATADAAAATDAAPADTAAATDAAATTAVDSGLPQACEDYLNRTKACLAKANPQAAAAYQQGIDQTKASWDAMADKSGLTAACTAANDAFAQTAAALQCE